MRYRSLTLILAELDEQRKLSRSRYWILMYAALFLITGFVLYIYLVAPEVKKLQSAYIEHSKQNKLMKDIEEKTRNSAVLANNFQLLKAEMMDLRSRVFNDENDTLTFMRSLPVTTDQTGNTLMSIVPNEAKPINVPPPIGVASNNKNVQSAAVNTPPPPTTLPCKLKPIEMSFDGGYGSVIDLFKDLDKSGQYMTVSSMNIITNPNNVSQVSIKTVLNLVELGIEIKKPQTRVTSSQQGNSSLSSTNLVDAAIPVKNVSVTSPTQVSKPVKSIQANEQVANAQKPINIIQSHIYSVRVGKFDYYYNAQNLINILQSHGYASWLKTYSYKRKITYWVYVGSFASKDEAETFGASMQKELSNYIDDYVIMSVKKGTRNNILK